MTLRPYDPMTRLLHKNFLFILGTDALLFGLAWYGAYQLRFNFDIPPESVALLVRFLPLIALIKIVTFYFFDLYKGMWRYTSLADLFNIIKAASVSSLLVISVILFTHRFVGFARSVFIIDWVLTIFLVSGYRVGIRLYFWLGSGDESARLSLRRFLSRGKRSTAAKNLLIIGAGDAGEKIYRVVRGTSLNY